MKAFSIALMLFLTACGSSSDGNIDQTNDQVDLSTLLSQEEKQVEENEEDSLLTSLIEGSGEKELIFYLSSAGFEVQNTFPVIFIDDEVLTDINLEDLSINIRSLINENIWSSGIDYDIDELLYGNQFSLNLPEGIYLFEVRGRLYSTNYENGLPYNSSSI
ncbi:MAG: hypothetical protein GY828_08040 [Candidatus Gracilibacteria bacterium]|nr:hypothetical protein [Candidatus Gracilibacteria bacterium]